MGAAKDIISLLKSHFEGNDTEVSSLALEVAAREARAGHTKVAQEIRSLVDKARNGRNPYSKKPLLSITSSPVQLPGDLAQFLAVSSPEEELSSLILSEDASSKLRRVLTEQRQKHKLQQYNLQPRRKLLLVGPPGSGKTLSARALAGELKLPLYTVLLEGIITKYLGETATRLRQVFDAMQKHPGVYFFDEFDALGGKRTQTNEVGEIRRVLNSFLQLLENDPSSSVIVAATNHPELLDRALFRRFDDVIEYHLPTQSQAREVLERYLGYFDTTTLNWSQVLAAVQDISHAELAKVAQDAAKTMVLEEHHQLSTDTLLHTLKERQHHMETK